MYPFSISMLIDGALPWYLRPPPWIGGQRYVCPTVYIFRRGVISPVSAKSYLYSPLVVEGTAFGSTARNFASLFPRSFSRMNGYASPAKLLPPPMQPTM